MNSNNFSAVIQSLLTKKDTPDYIRIPDGVTDTSDVLSDLIRISEQGRVIYSDHRSGIESFLAYLLQEPCWNSTSEISVEDYKRIAGTLLFFVVQLLREVPKVTNLISAEEMVRIALNSTTLKDLKQEMEATPYTEDDAERRTPLISQLSIFADETVITSEMYLGFCERQLDPLLKGWEDYQMVQQVTETGSPNADYEIIDISEISEDSVVDEFEGFDDFLDFYFEEMGDLDD